MELCGLECRGWRDLDDQAVFLKHDLLECARWSRREGWRQEVGGSLKLSVEGAAWGGSGEMGKGDAKAVVGRQTGAGALREVFGDPQVPHLGAWDGLDL